MDLIMKKVDFYSRIIKCPQVVPVFVLTRDYREGKKVLKKGTEIFVASDTYFYGMKGNTFQVQITPTVSYLKFSRYADIRDNTTVVFEKSKHND